MWNPIPTPYRALASVVAGIALTLAVFFAGWTVNGWRWEAKIADEKEQAHQQEIAAIAQRDLERQKLEEMGRQMVKKLQDQEAKANDYYRKWRNEIGKVTSGTVCLGPDAGVVWDAALYGEGNLPAPTTRTDETPSATDTAVLTNATDNFKQYAECRRQLNALIDWHEKR